MNFLQRKRLKERFYIELYFYLEIKVIKINIL